MDNENKIREFKIDPDNVNVDLFLPSKFDTLEEKIKLYNLEEEFAKTKKNKDIFSTLLFILFILLISVSSLALIFQSQKGSQKLSVDIADLEDINILEILNTTRSYEDDLARIRVELEDLQKKKERDILDVKEDIKKRIDYINITQKKQTQEKIDTINNLKKEQTKRINNINEAYRPKIEKKEKEIKILEEKLKIFDQEKIKVAQDKEDIILSDDQVKDYQIKEIEKKYQNDVKKETDYYKKRIERLEDYYKNLINDVTLKYNPILTDQNIVNILNKDRDVSITYENKLSSDYIYPNKDIIGNLREMQEELGLVHNQLNDIPFENSVPDLLRRIEQLEKKISNLYEDIILELINQKKSVEKNLSYYTTILNKYANNFLDRGYIIDASNSNDIDFILPKNVKINNGDIKRVIRQHYIVKDGKSYTEVIGTIEFYLSDDNVLKVKIKDIKKNKNFHSFDIIVLTE